MRRQRPDQADWSGLCRNKPAWVGYGTHLTESCDPDAKPHLQAVALAAAINVCRFVDYLAGTGLRTTTLSVTELVRGFSDYLNRVAYRGERFISHESPLGD